MRRARWNVSGRGAAPGLALDRARAGSRRGRRGRGGRARARRTSPGRPRRAARPPGPGRQAQRANLSTSSPVSPPNSSASSVCVGARTKCTAEDVGAARHAVRVVHAREADQEARRVDRGLRREADQAARALAAGGGRDDVHDVVDLAGELHEPVLLAGHAAWYPTRAGGTPSAGSRRRRAGSRVPRARATPSRQSAPAGEGQARRRLVEERPARARWRWAARGTVVAPMRPAVVRRSAYAHVLNPIAVGDEPEVDRPRDRRRGRVGGLVEEGRRERQRHDDADHAGEERHLERPTSAPAAASARRRRRRRRAPRRGTGRRPNPRRRCDRTSRRR